MEFGVWRGVRGLQNMHPTLYTLIASDWEADLLNEFTAALAGRGAGVRYEYLLMREEFLQAEISPNRTIIQQYQRDGTGCFSYCYHCPLR